MNHLELSWQGMDILLEKISSRDQIQQLGVLGSFSTVPYLSHAALTKAGLAFVIPNATVCFFLHRAVTCGGGIHLSLLETLVVMSWRSQIIF